MIPHPTNRFGALVLAGLALAVALTGAGAARAETTLETPDGAPVLDVVGDWPADDAGSAALISATGRSVPNYVDAARATVQLQGKTERLHCARWALGRISEWWRTTLASARGLWLRAQATLFGSRN